MNILNYLDNQINLFKQNTGDYPSKIIMSQDTKDKIFEELGDNILLSWADRKDNYKGIPIKIKEDIFIELI